MTPTEIMLPLDDVQDWERYEGMLVTFPQELTVNEVYNLGRYGELTLSAGGRLYQPTNIAQPGPDTDAVAERRPASFLLDDANNQQNADPTLFHRAALAKNISGRALVSPG
jgi:predicted extracellular nuclease